MNYIRIDNTLTDHPASPPERPLQQPNGAPGKPSNPPGHPPSGTTPRSTLAYLFSLTSANSARPPDARWRIAEAIATGLASRRNFAKDLDEWVKLAVKYLLALQQCQSDDDREQLAQHLPHVHGAYQLHNADKLTRGIAEARLLAGQAREEVATSCDLSVETVTAYEALFFRVDRRNSRLSIITQAVGSKVWDGTLTENDPDVLLKWLGYYTGPLFLEPIIRYFRFGLEVPLHLGEVSRADLEELVVMLQVKSMIQAHTLPFPQCNRALRLFELSLELKSFIEASTAQLPGEAGTGQQESVVRGDSDPCRWWSQWREAALAA